MWVLDGNGFTMAVSLSGEGTSPCIATQRGQERWRAPSTLPDQRSNIAERFHRVQGGWPEFSLPPHTRNNVRPADGVRPKTRRSGEAHMTQNRRAFMATAGAALASAATMPV